VKYLTLQVLVLAHSKPKASKVNALFARAWSTIKPQDGEKKTATIAGSRKGKT
jgi:hypothetical protein